MKKNEDGTSGIPSDWDLALRVKHENGQFIESNRRYRTVSSSSSILGLYVVLTRQITTFQDNGAQVSWILAMGKVFRKVY